MVGSSYGTVDIRGLRREASISTRLNRNFIKGDNTFVMDLTPRTGKEKKRGRLSLSL